MRVKQ